MKKITMCYFVSLAGLNAVFALCLPSMVAYFKSEFGMIWGCPYPWWPWVGVVVCVAGVLLSLWKRVKEKVLRNLLVVVLFVEIGIMFLTVVAFTAPFYSIIGSENTEETK